jgi:hypothetical protein
VTKEVPLDAEVEELLNSSIKVALVGLGGKSSTLSVCLHATRYLELIRMYT